MKKYSILLIVILSVMILFVSCNPKINPKTYTIFFEKNGADSGSCPANFQVIEGNTFLIPDGNELSKKGYDLEGWNITATGDGADYKIGSYHKAQSDLILYAKWNLHTYSITYKLNGGTLSAEAQNPTEYTITTEDFTLANPTKEGSTFLGWKLEGASDSPKVDYSISKGTTGDLTLLAVWDFSVTFDPNGASGTPPSPAFIGEDGTFTVPEPKSLRNTGYQFNVWNTNADGTGDTFIPGEKRSVNKTTTLYAIWIEDYWTFAYSKETDSYSVGCNTNALTTYNIPNSFKGKKVDGIKESGFKSNNNLTSIVVPEFITSIGKSAFWGCENLTSVELPNSITSIAIAVFSGCTNLKSITVPNSVKSIEAEAFLECCNLENITIPNSVKTIGKNAFKNCKKLTTIRIPDEVTIIDECSFWLCDALTTITLPNKLTNIKTFAFSQCIELESIDIPTSVTKIGRYAFNGCKKLASIKIPEGVTLLEQYVLNGCDNLETIELPHSITEIESYAATKCRNLTTIKYHGTEEEWKALKKPSDWVDKDLTINYEFLPLT